MIDARDPLDMMPGAESTEVKTYAESWQPK
jgi:hypothetical protein